MTQRTEEVPEERAPLSRQRVLQCAVELADKQGIGALTMRSLAQSMGVKPMSLYHHVANKEEILDGIVDIVFSEIELPAQDGDWDGQMRRRAHSARQVLGRHTWAIGLLESRTAPGPATLRHHDATLGVLRAAGFSLPRAAHAYALLDSYVYGFALQEASMPLGGPEPVAEVAAPILDSFSAEEYPHLFEMATEHVLRPGYSFADEFEIGLEVILEALARWIPDHGETNPS
jgi:AcrR family transcriptional regulator